MIHTLGPRRGAEQQRFLVAKHKETEEPLVQQLPRIKNEGKGKRRNHFPRPTKDSEKEMRINIHCLESICHQILKQDRDMVEPDNSSLLLGK